MARGEFCAEVVFDLDDDGHIEYDGKNVDSFFNAIICGKDKREVQEKTLELLDKIRFLVVWEDKRWAIDEIYKYLKDMQEAVRSGETGFAAGGNRRAEFIYIYKKSYTVEV